MSDSTVPPHLGFVGKSEKQPMEIEGGVSGSAETLGPGRGLKRPPSPPIPPGDDEDSPKSTTSNECNEWLVSDSGSEEDEDHHNQGTCHTFTVNDFPRASCDFKEQAHLLYRNPETKLRGPPAIMLYGKHVFASDYNLVDKSEISVSDVGDCSNDCRCCPMDLLQFIDAKIAGYRHTHPGRAKIFGFVAVRDMTEPLRNYVYNREINNCEAVSVKRKTGVARLSLTGPARVVSCSFRALIEVELHAQSEEETDVDDGLIIEGCTELDNTFEVKSFIKQQRMYGTRCALDIKYAVLINAVEARVEVKVLSLSTIAGGVNMKVYVKTSGFNDVIRLFQGAAPEPGFMKSFAVAVKIHNSFDLYIEGSAREDPLPGQKPLPFSWCRCSFASRYHGTVEEVAELEDFATVSVKVTWKSYRQRAFREFHR